MSSELKISAGQYSDKGRKEINQDFHGIYVPKEPQLSAKGIAVALADGISSSAVSDVASQYAVTGFLEDYYCTSEAWSVKTSAERILSATNSWLHAQTQKSQYRYDKDKGYVCTLSAMVIKSTTAHIFHVGDSRIYRLRGRALEQLTSDHRVWISQGQSYLGRALGIKPQLEIDYQTQQVEQGDIFLLATDGVYEHVSEHDMAAIIHICAGEPDGLETAARSLVEKAFQQGSTDNLTAQIVRVDALPRQHAGEVLQQLSSLPLPPILDARTAFDGYTIIREVHGSSRSHIYLAVDGETGAQVILKTPSIDLQADPAYLERFLTEEWIARRINNAHVLKPYVPTRKRHYVYVATEYIDGQTLSQWMIDNPRPELEAVRGVVEQIAKGLRAFHRLEMLHQDLRPDNIMIDRTGTVKIIDFGSTRVASLTEAAAPGEPDPVLGTAQYAAPEYFLGEGGTTRSDIFSLGVITYQMLTGRLPYGAEVAKCRTRAAQNRLRYDSALHDDREIPAWIDGVLRKALHPDPARRYDELSEFLYDLRHPNRAFLDKTRPPLLERNPLLFWKGVSLILAGIIVVLVGVQAFVR
ncbi:MULTISPECIES: bifunctional protein-serine/threonine kinase/phosphatase [unclassified Polaromonas]|jgi:serine/threonine protein phosphatase PrpC|uniref:bifunctional protein-serine/threonine kinase/phosphatase n=1 Tax=unclassified Polaromonas TaxID=2638319 RepID=UPI000BCAF5BA|nr:MULTISPECIES: bifunctional protein-serine/threonine kinase/phosphatase [unclassified Polaromonas]OYY39193.1 MAG: protein kinase [Polaromonas sp. 35-63-35]OYZ22059.1 MAG: protein kinase [Polaromonas sp. 16-63-31]OYZ80498.1 MAG: protein kinase [Polaromonas sp. 24-63-21]OZA51559.1 MAG: protein kinase [Polaromonas sp. 17-63-33]OZA89968.1 MAG: protein kinase [Polaromonas sp. 39-63-25]